LPKVNWEKEIDEEIEKQKRKKKTTVEKKLIAAVEVPQLPKPKNPSPKPNRIIATPETKKDNDLLGLQNGEDSFTGFLSAPSSNVNSIEQDKKKDDESVELGKSEEESFFNQTIPTEKEKVKLTKDNILALYSNVPATSNYNQFQNVIPNQQQVPYQANFSTGQNQFQNFGGYPQSQQTFPMQNGLIQQQYGNVQWNAQFTGPSTGGQIQSSVMSQYSMPTTNQFQNGPTAQLTNFQNNSQFSQNQFGQQFQQSGVPPPQNPFFSNQKGLQQQFANLSLSSQTTATNGAPTLATNIWQ